MQAFPPVSDIRHLVSRFPKSLKQGILAYEVDRLVSRFIDPRDTLVISGFWRSGTTWLQQSLAKVLKAKSVYEPLSPLVHDIKEVYFHDHLSTNNKDVSFLRFYMPFCSGTTLDGHPLRELFYKALRAEVSGGRTRFSRTRLTEAFRLKVVVKFIRAHLCLRAAQETFFVPAIHIYRDPRSVVASMKRLGWKWFFNHLVLRDQLLEPRDGRAQFFGQWHDEILEYDKKGEIARAAAYWALTEKFLQHCYSDHQARISFLRYEELCQKRETLLLETLRKLTVAYDVNGNARFLDIDSDTTSEQRRKASVGERVEGWKETLSGSEISTIESIARRFGFEDRLYQEEDQT